MATESDGFHDARVEGLLFSGTSDKIPAGAFYIKCSCAEKFIDFDAYDSHRAHGKAACRQPPVLKQRPNASNNPFSKSRISSDKQLGAFFGDLDHKREIVNKYQRVGNEVQSFYDNRHQAWYVKKFFPDLVVRVPGSLPPSDKTVGTIFEFNFHTNISFRFAYLRWLPAVLAFAPFEDSEPVFDREVLDLGDATEVNVDPLIRSLFNGKVKAEEFMLPIHQINPLGSLPPGDPNHIFDWANSERYWRNYPELMGYNRQAAFVTSGDYYPWMISSICRYDGLGCIAVHFPSIRSPFDGEENNPSLGQLDGLSHWQWAGKIEGFNYRLQSQSEMTHFIDDKYNDARYDAEVPIDLLGSKTYVLFKGVPNRRSYFTLQRFVVWNDQQPHMPRPDSPGPVEHPDLIVAAEISENSTTYAQALPARSSLVMPCEHSMPLSTGAYRVALAFNLMPDVVALKRNFSEIIVTNVRAEVRQEHLLGTDSLEVSANGRVFVAVIPSGKNTDAASGTNGATVMSVRRKQAFPLSSTIQENKVYSFDLTGFETDVAQDPRRQQGLVAWLGNTGITAAVKGETFPFVSVTWYFDCVCTGIAANW